MIVCENFRCIMRPYLMLFALLLVSFGNAVAQEEEVTKPVKDTRPVKNTFESIWLMNHQTLMVPIKGTLEMDFQHRFGTWENGYDDFYGIFAPSNMRIGFDYTPADRLLIGFGFTKENLLWDLYGKYAILRQGRSGGSPVSVTYYVNAAVDTREKEKTNFEEGSDRWSFFHQVMVGRKFSEDFSLQLSGNLSWFNHNLVVDDEGVVLGLDDNMQISVSAIARYKISNTIAATLEYDLPFENDDYFDPEPNLGMGLELVTSAHAFQVFVGNYHHLVPQYDQTFNSNKFFGTGNLDGNEILIGFNITRLWNF